jgi:hypothetical protein
LISHIAQVLRMVENSVADPLQNAGAEISAALAA